MFNDKKTKQLFTIAYAEDDDFVATNQNLINVQATKIKALQGPDARKNADKIKEETAKLKYMQEELKLDQNMRSMILNRNQMICIPYDLGLTGSCYLNDKAIYDNDFDLARPNYFYNESDNIKALKVVTSFVFIPMIGHDELPNGVIQCYNFKAPVSRLQLKKMYAIRKFYGGCLDYVNYMSQNLEIISGHIRSLKGTFQVVNQRKAEVDALNKDITQLYDSLTIQKEINQVYTEIYEDLKEDEPEIDPKRAAAMAAIAAADAEAGILPPEQNDGGGDQGENEEQ